MLLIPRKMYLKNTYVILNIQRNKKFLSKFPIRKIQFKYKLKLFISLCNVADFKL